MVLAELVACCVQGIHLGLPGDAAADGRQLSLQDPLGMVKKNLLLGIYLITVFCHSFRVTQLKSREVYFLNMYL